MVWNQLDYGESTTLTYGENAKNVRTIGIDVVRGGSW